MHTNYKNNIYTLLTRIEVKKQWGQWGHSAFALILQCNSRHHNSEDTARTTGDSYMIGGLEMKEELNSLLVKIEQIAIEENIPDIIYCIDKISKLLGDDYEIYKLGDD